MIAHKVGPTLKINAYCQNGHAFIFLTSLKVEQPSATFAVASVLGVNFRDGIFSESHPAQDSETAEKWAKDFARQKFGEGVQFGQREEVRE